VTNFFHCEKSGPFDSQASDPNCDGSYLTLAQPYNAAISHSTGEQTLNGLHVYLV